MEGISLVRYWKEVVDKSIISTWKEYNSNADHLLLLTENDVKCLIYNELRQNRLEFPFSVHSEVTHYANYKLDSKYHFRDLVLLNPLKIRNNIIDYPEDSIKGIKSKGFSHVGESIFFEIKFQRTMDVQIIPNDIENLTTYRYRNKKVHPKFAILIWGSKHAIKGANLLVDQMVKALNEFSQKTVEPHLPVENVFGFVFNHQELWEVKWEVGGWKPKQIR